MAATVTMTNQQIKDVIEAKGLAYVISGYISPDQIQDKFLATLWSSATNLLDAIDSYLGEQGQ